MKAVCLISGGLDSAVAGAIARSQGYEVHALTFDYGQRHSIEVECARKITKWLDSEHKIFNIDMGQFGGSALTDEIEIPEGKSIDEIRNSNEIPPTYVPARNTIFLSIALAYAEVISAQAIFIGAHAVDYSGYPDCRPEYFEEFRKLAGLATKRGAEGSSIGIETPLLELGKTEIIRKGSGLEVPFQHTWSCYKGEDKACGVCDSCVIRLNGFKEAGLEDPIEYESQ
ncbi:MAG: 7-cyano-7-deazaguanine synthase QueC [Candidatus Altiarchaeota archaeon]|nr:7-cyano-7-deazaguanine synthase QueC [Candidatus Altiarchaeota archaeon]MBU4341114.1 7-cyano-7-deazaguanine synthase QueC [Candidatus Altiarchaeota archaeon]MBU4405988.1 7-cyano-7-deazaguanine synthase QueC [Candidatus Altiarchaeota archaeon]MBU4437216.1 7-cyano-7-deazaguanine synthase QueC [Candidatus Altiarchaeota archaeon]